ncbi:MAG: hypothetical protein R2745_19000 [Vicinamibacterales bacterium]
MTRHVALAAAAAVAWTALAGLAFAQPLGTFRWQQLPYCNVISLAIVQEGAAYRLDGVDDQCAGDTVALVTGLAVPNPNGTIGFGLTIVTTPGGVPLHLEASMGLPSLAGSWRDSTGKSGAWTFTPGAPAPGTPRPVPRATFPAGLSAGGRAVSDVATPVDDADAATKAYVDTRAVNAGAPYVPFTGYAARVASGAVTPGFSGCVHFDLAAGSSIVVDLPLRTGAVPTVLSLKYLDTSASAVTFQLHAVDFGATTPPVDQVVDTVVAPDGFGATGYRYLVVPLLQGAVSETHTYYVSAAAPAHAGTLAFCGGMMRYKLSVP